MIVGRSSGRFLNVLFTKSCASSLNVVGNSYFSCVTLLNVPCTAANDTKEDRRKKIHHVVLLSVSNGGRPVNNVTMRIPNDQTSVAKL